MLIAWTEWLDQQAQIAISEDPTLLDHDLMSEAIFKKKKYGDERLEKRIAFRESNGWPLWGLDKQEAAASVSSAAAMSPDASAESAPATVRNGSSGTFRSIELRFEEAFFGRVDCEPIRPSPGAYQGQVHSQPSARSECVRTRTYSGQTNLDDVEHSLTSRG